MAVTLTTSDSWEIYSYPAVLDDGNTFAWFIAEEAYITTDGEDGVTVWADKTNNGYDLTASDSLCPSFSDDSVSFVAANSMVTGTISDYTFPIFIYIVFKQTDYNAANKIFEGDDATYTCLYQGNSTGRLFMYSGSGIYNTTNWGLTAWRIGRFLFNDDNSSYEIDEIGENTGDTGPNDPTLFRLGQGGLSVAMSIKEVIIRGVADGEADQQAIYDYLEDKHGL